MNPTCQQPLPRTIPVAVGPPFPSETGRRVLP